MSLTVISGDVLAIPRGLLLHQVNCQGITGGLAGALRRKYSMAFAEYSRSCREFKVDQLLGLTLIGEAAENLFLGHVFGQPYPGPNTSLPFVDMALADAAAQHAKNHSGLPVYAPFLMGCGLGGGRWADYEPLIAKHFPSATIVKLPSNEG